MFSLCFSSYNYGYQHQIQFQSTSCGAKKGIKSFFSLLSIVNASNDRSNFDIFT